MLWPDLALISTQALQRLGALGLWLVRSSCPYYSLLALLALISLTLYQSSL